MKRLSSYTGGGGHSTACDHSANFPRKFEICLKCGKKGVYTCYNPSGTLHRCRYCGDQWVDWR